MPDLKITQLPTATTPAGTELAEIVQGGVNKKVTLQEIADLAPEAGIQSIVAGTNVTVDDSDPLNPIVSASGGGSGTVESVTGDGVDNTDPANPVINLSGYAQTTSIIGVQDLFIPASAMWPRVTSGCSTLTQFEIATSLFNIQGLEFSATVQQFAQMQLVLPRKWNNGTITAVVYWKPLASGSGDVRWGIQAGAYSNDDPLTTALGTEVAVTDTYIAENDLHITGATSAITIAGSPADADFLAIQINRDPTNGSDTLDVNAVLLGISIRITTNAAVDG